MHVRPWGCLFLCLVIHNVLAWCDILMSRTGQCNLASSSCSCRFLRRQVTKPAPLVFTVVDRGESLGAVSVPLRQISSASPKRRWEPLTRNNAADIGELCFDCWVTAYRQSTPKWNLKTTGLKKDLRVERRRSLHNTSVSLKGSRSMENLHSMCNNFDVINTLTLGMLRRSHSGILATDHTADQLDAGAERPQSLTVPGPQSRALPSRSAREDEVILTVPEHRAPVSAPPVEQCAVPGDQPGRGDSAPEITGLSPKFGAASGGTRITLRGQNLGASREDIISLSVCGCDLLPNLQYFSSGKLVVVTRPWRGSGPVVIVTRSGGRAASTVKFSFEGSDSNEQGEYVCHLAPGKIIPIRILSPFFFRAPRR